MFLYYQRDATVIMCADFDILSFSLGHELSTGNRKSVRTNSTTCTERGSAI